MGGAGVCLPKGSTLFPRLTCPPPPRPPPTDSVKSSSSEHLGVASWPLVYLAVSPAPHTSSTSKGFRPGTEHPSQEQSIRRPLLVGAPPPCSCRLSRPALGADLVRSPCLGVSTPWWTVRGTDGSIRLAAPPAAFAGPRQQTALFTLHRPVPPSLPTPPQDPPPFTQPAGLALPSLTQSCEDVAWGPSGGRFQPSLGLSSL